MMAIENNIWGVGGGKINNKNNSAEEGKKT